ncbi:MAG TPA: hypothetical protein VH023_16435, partial [Rhodopila sp.]|nr:hypothetical protein [Rhodopila sp.]
MPELARTDKLAQEWEQQGDNAPDRDALAALDRAGLPEPESAIRMPSAAQRGRGAVTNPAVRFEPSVVSPFDDGWDALTGEIEEPVQIATTLIKDATKSAIAWNASP